MDRKFTVTIKENGDVKIEVPKGVVERSKKDDRVVVILKKTEQRSHSHEDRWPEGEDRWPEGKLRKGSDGGSA